jgi:predicted CXXCH cytochrome family protein
MTAYHTGWRTVFLLTASLLLATIITPAVLAQETAAEKPDNPCYTCHSKPEITPWIAATWAGSPHAVKGVACSDCHGNHDAGFDSDAFTALPGPQICHSCHPIQVKEMLASKHAGLTKCTSCHPRHGFSLRVARDPNICVTCHAGTPHVDGYAKSKMGAIYMAEGPGSSATCQSCHMPDGTHNVGLTLSIRERMLKVCNRCHSASFAGRVLSSGSFKLHW